MPKFWIRSPRYINGVYVFASPNFPAEVELPEGTKVDSGLIPYDEKPEKPTPHFAKRSGTPSAAEAFGPPGGTEGGGGGGAEGGANPPQGAVEGGGEGTTNPPQGDGKRGGKRARASDQAI